MLMQAAALVVVMLLGIAPVAAGADLIAEARAAYNAGDLDAAISAARQALDESPVNPEARIVLGRALVERYRQTASSGDLNEAREALIAAASPSLTPSLRVEWLIGTAETMFFEGSFGAAAELFASVIDAPRAIAVPGGRERLLDWWATAADRAAQKLEGPAREAAYRDISARLRSELHRDPSLGAASYWLVIATRGAGDLDGAWYAAQAAWARAALTADRGAALRADLERAVSQALIPERSRRGGQDDPERAEALRLEWEDFKQRWTMR